LDALLIEKKLYIKEGQNIDGKLFHLLQNLVGEKILKIHLNIRIF
jgi:hypothetical protein